MMRFFDWNKIRCLSVLMLLALMLLTACADAGTEDTRSTADGTAAEQSSAVSATDETAEETAEITNPSPESETVPAVTEVQTETTVTEVPMPQITTTPETEAVTVEVIPVDPDEYFENNLFVGDSILEGLAQYVRAKRQEGTALLSDAKFLTSIMGIRVADLVGDTAEYERIRYQYRGAVRELSEIVTLAEPKRLFLLIGMNDLAGGASVDDTVARYERLLTQLKQQFPTLQIAVMTPTPKTASAWLPDYCTNPDFGSPLLREFADRLMALCETMEVPCVDLFSALADETGNLPDNFSRDNYVHINDLGSAVAADTLNRFAQEDTNE